MKKVLILIGTVLFVVSLSMILSYGDHDDDHDDDSSMDDDSVFDDDDNTESDDDDNATPDDDDDTTTDDDDDDTVAGPTSPANHNNSWDCYLCHEGNFLGVTTPEPHDHVYSAPVECIGCHQEGDWVNPPYAGGHSWASNCLLCHGTKHGKTWEEKAQCLVCHGSSKK